MAMLVEDLLFDMGCEIVGPAASAGEALAAAKAEQFDIALLDVNLGDGETSFETAEVLRARGVPSLSSPAMATRACGRTCETRPSCPSRSTRASWPG